MVMKKSKLIYLLTKTAIWMPKHHKIKIEYQNCFLSKECNNENRLFILAGHYHVGFWRWIRNKYSKKNYGLFIKLIKPK